MPAGLVPLMVVRKGSILGLSPWLVDGCLLSGSSHCLPSIHNCLQISSAYKDTTPTGLVLTF